MKFRKDLRDFQKELAKEYQVFLKPLTDVDKIDLFRELFELNQRHYDLIILYVQGEGCYHSISLKTGYHTSNESLLNFNEISHICRGLAFQPVILADVKIKGR